MHRTKSKSLGRLFRFSKSLPEARAQRYTRGRTIAPSAYSPQQGAGEFLWPRRRVGRKSDKPRKQPERRAGHSLAKFPSRDSSPPDFFSHYLIPDVRFILPKDSGTLIRPREALNKSLRFETRRAAAWPSVAKAACLVGLIGTAEAVPFQNHLASDLIRGSIGSSCWGSIRNEFWYAAWKSKAFTTGYMEDHGGNPLVIKVDLFDALH